VKWQRFAHAIPEDLSGRTVLDIGCNGGFYSLEMKRRGAERVLGIDFRRALSRAGAARRGSARLDIEFRQLSVYDVAQLGEKFDVVIFMGVLYHLRHPLLALDLIHEHVARDLFVFQSMQRGQHGSGPVEEDYPFWRRGFSSATTSRRCTSSRSVTRAIPTKLVDPEPRLRRGDAAQLRLHDLEHPEAEVSSAAAA
jgi:SAM-dependent methyltransferase